MKSGNVIAQGCRIFCTDSKQIPLSDIEHFTVIPTVKSTKPSLLYDKDKTTHATIPLRFMGDNHPVTTHSLLPDRTKWIKQERT